MKSGLRKRKRSLKSSTALNYKSPWIPEKVYQFRDIFEDVQATALEYKQLHKNPFQGSDTLKPLDWAKLLLGVILIPIRVVIAIISVLVSSLMLIVVTAGSDTSKPLPKSVMMMQQNISRISSYIACFTFGVIVDVKGKPASPEKCSVQVWAPHSSMFDAIIVPFANDGQPSSAVAKVEVASNPLFKMVMKANQSILVDRSNAKSKKQAADQIVARATNKRWKRPVVIFPEGTTTNRTSLIQFKAGAFQAGVPIQPVVIRWDKDLAWSSGSASRTWLTFRSIAELYHVCEVEFLPVYTPSEEEIDDPILYANNVREVMASALELGTSDFGFPDRALALYAAKKGLLPSKVLNFSFENLVESVKGAHIDLNTSESEFRKSLLKDTKVLLSYYVEFCDVEKQKLTERGFKKIREKKLEKKIDFDGELDWSLFEDQDMVSFFDFASSILSEKYV